MKNLFSIVIVLISILGTSLLAQPTGDCKMRIQLKNTQFQDFRTADIDSVLFVDCFADTNKIPLITSIIPDTAKIGNEITIFGKRFGTAQGNSYVSFNGTNATDYISWNDTEIKLKVPEGATTGDVFVIVNGINSNNFKFWVSFIPPPQIADINTYEAKIGDEIIITGKYFRPTQGNSYVTVNDALVTEYISWNKEEIIVKVPKGSDEGTVFVTVLGVKSNQVDFYIINSQTPAISSINPDSAKVGDFVTIIGSNFGAVQGTSRVIFFGTEAVDYASWSDTEIQVLVPAGATSGNVYVYINEMNSNQVYFNVTGKPSPFIQSISPTSVKVGDEITIIGQYFGDEQGDNYVSVYGRKATEYTKWSNTEIKIKVPPARGGKLSVTVDDVKSNIVNFTILPSDYVFYDTVRIGNQTWMKKNLDVDYYRNGDPIKKCLTFPSLNNNEEGCCYYSWSDSLGQIYGKLYNGYAVYDPRCLAPKGWHIPREDEWDELIDYLGGPTIATKSLVSDDGFKALPGGCIETMKFYNLNFLGYWWAVKKTKRTSCYQISSNPNSNNVGNRNYYWDTDIKGLFFSVRCIKDEPPLITSINPINAKVGDFITITGRGFRKDIDTNFVIFKGIVKINAKDYQIWNDTLIKIMVPNGASTGKLSVSIYDLTSNEVDYTISGSNPVVDGTMPISAPMGWEITITGSNFGTTRGTNYVTFGNKNATQYTSWSDNAIKVVVPLELFPQYWGYGYVVVNVTVNGVKSNDLQLYINQVDKPVIISISPQNVKVGDEMTIKGYYFGNYRYDDCYVDFWWAGGITDSRVGETYYKWSDTEIKVKVPWVYMSGWVYVKLGTSNPKITNQIKFNLIP